MREKILPAIARVRSVVDRLEKVMPDDLWPIPTYREMLHLR
jgi:glutamine synthetase